MYRKRRKVLIEYRYNVITSLNKKITYTILAAVSISIFVIVEYQVNQIDSSKVAQEMGKDAPTVTNLQKTTTKKTPYITLYSLPKGTAPNSILDDKNGMVWVTSSRSNALYRVDPANNMIRKYQSSHVDLGHMSWSMVQDNKGFIWFAQFGNDPIVRFNPEDGKFLGFQTTDPPFQMKYDNNNNDIWFTTLSGRLGLVQKIDTKSDDKNAYKITEFPIDNTTQTSGLSIGNGSIWVTGLGGNIFKFDPVHSNDGTITNIVKTLEIPTSDNESAFAVPTDILQTNNDTLWITEHGPSTITKFDLQTHESIRLPTAKSHYKVATLPFWLRNSLDEKGIWCNEHEGGSAIFLANNMTMTEYQVPNESQDALTLMLNLAADPSDPEKLWFSLWSLDEIGFVDKSVLVPFEIHTQDNQVKLGTSKNQTIIHLSILKSLGHIPQDDHMIYLNATSSLDAGGELVNMTATFSQDAIDLDNMTSPTDVELSLKDQSLQKGNYTIGINAENGLVTRTIFVHVAVD